MAKLIKFTPGPSRKHGLRKAGKKRSHKPSAEDLGQLNLFAEKKTRVVRIKDFPNPFAEGLYRDEHDDPDNAEALYLKATHLGIHKADAYCNLAVLYAKQNDRSRAIEYLSKALVIDPRHLEAHFNLGNLYFDEGDLNLAILHYEVAREVDPSFPEVYFNLGLAYMVKNNRSKAQNIFKIYQNFSPDKKQEAEEILKRM